MVHNAFLTTCSIVAASILTIPVYSGDPPANTEEWVSQAEEAFDAVMKYPRLALRDGSTGGATFVVTINHEGEVVDYYNTSKKRGMIFKSATSRSIKKADFPAIPINYDGEMLSFKLETVYATMGPMEHMRQLTKKKVPKGAVKGSYIALLPTVSLANAR